MIRLSAMLAAALWPEHQGATRAVTVQRSTAGRAGGRRPGRRGGGGVYRGSLFRKTVIRDLMMRPLGNLIGRAERNERKRQRRARGLT